MIEFDLEDKTSLIVYPPEKMTKKDNAAMWDQLESAMEAAIVDACQIIGIDCEQYESLDTISISKQCLETLCQALNKECIDIQYVDEEL